MLFDKIEQDIVVKQVCKQPARFDLGKHPASERPAEEHHDR